MVSVEGSCPLTPGRSRAVRRERCSVCSNLCGRTHSRILQPAPKQRGDVDEQLKSFDHVPLFMRNLPRKEGGDDASNVALEALQSLAFEGHPDGVLRLLAALTRRCGGELQESGQ